MKIPTIKHSLLMHWVYLTSALLLGINSTTAVAQDQTIDHEWPCIQAYVPEVAAAVIWPEPITEEQTGSWRNDATLKKVVRDFGNLEFFTDNDRERLAQFAESIPEEARIDTYNRAVDGIVAKFNQRRREYFKGIRKYTRQQINIAKTIEERLNEIATLADKADAESLARKNELNENATWQQRIFDRRESAIGLLCESPVELEVVMGEVVRELSYYLP